jgi:HK97 family phage major capsid protein
MVKVNRLQEIEQRKKEIRKILESGQECDLDALEKELRELDKEKEQIERRKTLLEGIKTAQEVEQRQFPGAENPLKEDPKKEERKAREERGKALKESRSVTVGASNIILPRHDATDIKPTFNEVSSLIDRVNRISLPGGETFRQPYLIGYGEGGYTAEGADYTDAEPTFGYAVINKSKVTAYAEDSEEVLRLPAADYDSVVMNGITVALRKKITKEILVGDGSTNHLAGIFSAAATAIDPATDLEISGITKDTLDEIIYSFGGEEDVEDVAVLILNKKDLQAFAMLRDSQDRKVYEVVNRGNTGTINGVPFIINSACAAISDPNTPAGAFCMAYGPLSNYTLAIFSDVEVQRSTDYKFKQGMIAHKGSVFVGGNVTAKNGFLRVKKDDGV